MQSEMLPPPKASSCAVKLIYSFAQYRINHMAEAAYAMGPALLGPHASGAPRFSLLFFSEFFVSCFSTGPKQCARAGPQRV